MVRLGAMDQHPDDALLMNVAIKEAELSFAEGGIPIGAVLVRGNSILATGHNERVQEGDPIAHAEIACLRNAGRQKSYADMTLYTTLSPCQMCSGAILLFRIPRVVVGEATTFPGDLRFLASRGVNAVLLDNKRCVSLMQKFQQLEPQVWREDIGEA